MGEVSPLLVYHVVVWEGERYSLFLAPYHLPQMRELTISLTRCGAQETVPTPYLSNIAQLLAGHR